MEAMVPSGGRKRRDEKEIHDIAQHDGKQRFEKVHHHGLLRHRSASLKSCREARPPNCSCYHSLYCSCWNFPLRCNT